MALGPAIASLSPFACFRAPAPAAPARFAAAGTATRCRSRLFCRSGAFHFPACRRAVICAARVSPCASAIAGNLPGKYIFGELHRRGGNGGGSLVVRAASKTSESAGHRGDEKARILSVFVGRVFGVVVAAAVCAVFATGCQRVLAEEGVSHVSVGILGRSGVVLRDAWPKISQVLCIFREQGLVLAGLLGLSAFFSMAETSITTLWPWKVRELAEKEPEDGVFRMLRSDVTRFLTTILIGTTVVNIGATALVTEAATTIFGEAGISAATGVMTPLKSFRCSVLDFLSSPFGELVKTFLGQHFEDFRGCFGQHFGGTSGLFLTAL